jgi:RNA polymerase sigma-54 factor
MALKQTQQLKLLQKLSPQQIQLMKLLQLPTLALEQRIKEELEANPALEEGNEEEIEQQDDFEDDVLNESDETDNEQSDEDAVMEDAQRMDDEISIDDFMDEEEVADYKYEINNSGKDNDFHETPITVGPGFHDLLEQQLGLQDLNEQQYKVGLYLIGCIDEDGYLRRDMESIVDDIAFSQNVNTTIQEIEELLKVIQTFDPAGVGARNLQECLLLQLERKNPKTREIYFAIDVVKNFMDEFSKKHYEKIAKNIGIKEDEELKEIITSITQLNPKPGDSSSGSAVAGDVVPDFFINNADGKLELSLNQRNLPELKLSKDYLEMLTEYSKNKDKSSKEATTFVKSKIESAQWFIDALFQRQQTLLVTMNAIMNHQEDYFLTGDETKLKPMILKDIAEKIGLDISTVSRVANSKYVTTPFGNFLLKSFFAESLSTESGEEVSTREVKKILKDCIESENKKKPLTDDALMIVLKQKGYNIARRTVAKYREQLDIPVARLRKEI